MSEHRSAAQHRNNAAEQPGVPASARIWNYWLGGTDNYEVDRTVGALSRGLCPGIDEMARQSRRFLVRAVRYLAGEAGIRQFLDIGAGLPSMQNTHEVAAAVAPDARVVYVDNDPFALAHARTLLAGAPGVTYLYGDFHEPEPVLAAAALNPDEPVAVLFMGVLGHARTDAEMLTVVRSFMSAVPAGSYLALQDGSDDDESYVRLCAEYARSGGTPYLPRSKDRIRACFDGLELVAPGFVPLTRWRPDAEETGPISGWGGVARKS